MSLDYGIRSKSKKPGAALIAGLVALVAGVGAFGYNHFKERQKAIADAEAWTITGPPCPEITEAALRGAGEKADKKFEYDGVLFARAYGHVSCNEVGYDRGRGMGKYPACQFTAPSVLVIDTEQGRHVYQPGRGQPATVAVQHGKASCVMAARYKGQG